MIESTQKWSEWNALQSYTSLANRFLTLRHGNSEANLEKRIASNPANNGYNVRLTAVGREAVSRSAFQLREICPSPILISSDFARARETAEIVRDSLGSG